MTDEEIQSNIEKGQIGDGADNLAYRKVFDALQKEPSFRLPSNFSNTVLNKMRITTQSSRSELVWMYAGIFFFFLAAIVSIALTDFELNFGVLKFISGYQGLLVFGAAFILALHWIDRKFVRKMTV